MSQRVSRILWPSLCLIAMIAVLEGLTRSEWIPPYLFPKPSEILGLLSPSQPDLWPAALETLESALLGLSLSLAVGGLLCLISDQMRTLKDLLLPLSTFFQTVPIIAIAPLLVIYFGFGQPTAVASAFFVSIFPIIASGLLGLEKSPPELLELFRLWEASSYQQLFHLRLPFAYPYFRAGLRIAIGLAIIGAIAGEFVGGGGLGALIDSARTQQRLDLVYACLLVMSLMALALLMLLSLAHRAIQAWRPLP